MGNIPKQPNPTIGKTGEKLEIILLQKILEEIKKLNTSLSTTLTS
jgi:hypothetical protein